MRTVFNSVNAESFDSFEKFALNNQAMSFIKGGGDPTTVRPGEELVLADPDKK